MNISRYFSALISSYQAELDDLSTDSEGNNVLKARLAAKRSQVGQLLMMMDSAPEMVAVAFHGAFGFTEVKVIQALVAKESKHLPDWVSLKLALRIEPWAEPLIKTVLTDPVGQHFLATTVGLEYLLKHGVERSAPVVEPEDQDEEEDQEVLDHDRNEDYLSSDDVVNYEGETHEFDLDKAGAEFLAEQGFDRKG